MAKKNKKYKIKGKPFENSIFKDKDGEIFVFAEIGEKGFRSVVYELLNSAGELAKNYKSDFKVCALAVVSDENADFKPLFEAGADKVYVIKNENIRNNMDLAKAVSEICEEKKPEIFLIGATILGRTIAPLISSALKTGLTADCTKLDITIFKEEKKLAATRPTFGGKLMATILCKKSPQMATVRPSVFRRRAEIYKEEGEKEVFCPKIENFDPDCIKILDKKPKGEDFSFGFEGAKVIVAGGMGLKNEEGFNKLKKFASLIGAPYAGTRKAVEFGFVEKEFQIGQTGKTVSPNVYLAFGISGAIHHIMGMENSKKIVAINTDENAPIFENCDIIINEDAMKVLDELIAKIENQ